ncbi:MAG: hypothetical protein R3Y35_01080 [Clostridia bacterium]
MIFLIILAFIILITLIPITVIVDYNKKLQLSIKYLFLTFDLTKDKKQKAVTSSKKTKKEKKQENTWITKLKELYKEEGAGGLLNIIKILMKPMSKLVYNFVKCMRVKDLDIYFKVSGDDAAQTATNYGKACSIIYPFINGFSSLAHINKPRVTVDLDYNAVESVAIATCKINLIPLEALIKITLDVIILVKELLKFKKEENKSSLKTKGE